MEEHCVLGGEACGVGWGYDEREKYCRCGSFLCFETCWTCGGLALWGGVALFGKSQMVLLMPFTAWDLVCRGTLRVWNVHSQGKEGRMGEGGSVLSIGPMLDPLRKHISFYISLSTLPGLDGEVKREEGEACFCVALCIHHDPTIQLTDWVHNELSAGIRN